MIVLLGVVAFLYAFSIHKNALREITAPIVKFQGDDNLFITQKTVSKLLIQSFEGVKNVPKESLDLNTLETALNSNPMVKSAEVYVSVNGDLIAEVEQKKPIARVRTNASYYIDDQGSYMPLSSNYSARVPFVTGHIEKKNLANVFKIASKIYNDAFLKKHVIEIEQDVFGDIFLRLRQCNFKVQVGNLKQLDKKINNLKAFYQKASKEKILNNYSKINLQFDSQVICTKS